MARLATPAELLAAQQAQCDGLPEITRASLAEWYAQCAERDRLGHPEELMDWREGI